MTNRVVRGGSWYGGRRYVRAANRSWGSPDDPNYDQGFRLVQEEETDDTKRVIHGGSWFGNPWTLRSAYRYGYTPDYRNDFLGFRLAQENRDD